VGVSFSYDGVLDFVRGGYNSLFSGQALCGVLYFSSLVIWFGERRVVYLEDFLIWQSWECFFDLEDAGHGVGGLGIGHGGRQRAFTLGRACFLVFLRTLHLFLEGRGGMGGGIFLIIDVLG